MSLWIDKLRQHHCAFESERIKVPSVQAREAAAYHQSATSASLACLRQGYTQSIGSVRKPLSNAHKTGIVQRDSVKSTWYWAVLAVFDASKSSQWRSQIRILVMAAVTPFNWEADRHQLIPIPRVADRSFHRRIRCSGTGKVKAFEQSTWWTVPLWREFSSQLWKAGANTLSSSYLGRETVFVFTGRLPMLQTQSRKNEQNKPKIGGSQHVKSSVIWSDLWQLQ